MLAIQTGIAHYHCLYTEEAVAFKMPGVLSDSSGMQYIRRMLNKEFSVSTRKFFLKYPTEIRGAANIRGHITGGF